MLGMLAAARARAGTMPAFILRIRCFSFLCDIQCLAQTFAVSLFCATSGPDVSCAAAAHRGPALLAPLPPCLHSALVGTRQQVSVLPRRRLSRVRERERRRSQQQQHARLICAESS